jgi:protein-histidine N-methyltransferase
VVDPKNESLLQLQEKASTEYKYDKQLDECPEAK